MEKRLTVIVDEETHRLIRVALAEDSTDFSTWVRGHISKYLEKKGKLPKPKRQRKGKEG